MYAGFIRVTRHHRHLSGFLVLLVLALAVVPSGIMRSPTLVAAANPPTSVQNAAFVLDGVTVAVRSPFLPAPNFIAAAPGDVSQTALAEAGNPYRGFGVTAVPFGTTPGTELLPVAQAGGAAAYRAALHDFRAKQEDLLQLGTGPTATLFGQSVTSAVSLVKLNLDSVQKSPTVIVEWVVEAGRRLWIVRLSQEQAPGTRDLTGANAFLSTLSNLSLTSSTLDQPTTLAGNGGYVPPQAPPIPQSLNNLPFPSWWNGRLCDTGRYSGSYPLGGGTNLQGVYACGPFGTVAYVQFPGDPVLEEEWQCAEFSKRWMYLAYGVHGYQANGSQVVWNYRTSYGGNLQVINNGSAGAAPQVGDILSYGSISTAGHTSVVMSSSVVNGYGSIRVIQQNATSSGWADLSVSNWHVNSSMGVSGWLHKPSVVMTKPTVTMANRTQTAIALSWNNVNAMSYLVYRDGIQVGSTPGLSYTDVSSQPASFHYYSVVAIYDGGSRWSDPLTVATLAPLDPRTDLKYDGQADFTYMVPGATIDSFFSQGTGQYSEGQQSLPEFDAVSGLWLSGDFDGDGRGDLAYIYPGGYIDTFFSQGNGQYTGTTQSLPGFDSTGGTWMVGDFNEDGRTDLLYIYPGGYIDTFFSQGNGQYTGTTQSLPGFDTRGGLWEVGDFNGDGKTDLLYIYPGAYFDTFFSQGTGQYTEAQQHLPGFDMQSGIWKVGDFNGDGRTDLLYIYPGGYIDTFFSQGNGQYTGTTQSLPGFDTRGGLWEVGDCNGDGKTDLLYIYPGAWFDTFFSQGTGQYTEAQQHLPGFDMQSGIWMTRDLNGDRRSDLLYIYPGAYFDTFFSQGNGQYTGTTQSLPGFDMRSGIWMITVGAGRLPPWTDVRGNPFYLYIQNLYSRSVINEDGYPDNTFHPYENATRGILAKWVVRARGWAVNTTGGPHFSDVPVTDALYPYVETAYHHGVLSGYADGTFRPGNLLTRGQVSKMIVNALGWATNTSGGPHFRDVPPSNPFYSFIETAYNKGIISGYANGTFRWSSNVTRGQITKFLAGALDAP